jgi:hypothetical protein
VPSSFSISAANARATASVPPPADHGTIIVMGRSDIRRGLHPLKALRLQP